jgi:AraC-like DNA-binding protein
MTIRGAEPVSRPHALCGLLRLDHFQVDGDAVALETVHARPHFGYVLHGHFIVRDAGSDQEVVAGNLRFSAEIETLRLEIPAGFAALVGELETDGTRARGEPAGIATNSAVIEHLHRIAADPTHPALVDVERWALAEHCRANEPRRVARWPEDLVVELGTAPLGARAVRSWSERAGRHRSTLHRTFRRSLGVDPSGWILRERLRRAWRLLETEQPLVEIAIDCGFADQSHMSRVFRRFTGWTPGALRTERRRVAARMRPGSKTACAPCPILPA